MLFSHMTLRSGTELEKECFWAFSVHWSPGLASGKPRFNTDVSYQILYQHVPLVIDMKTWKGQVLTHADAR